MKRRPFATLLLGISIIATAAAAEPTEFSTRDPEVVQFGSDVLLLSGVVAGTVELELYLLRDGSAGFITRAEIINGSAGTINLEYARAEFDPPWIVLSDLVVDGTSFFGALRVSPEVPTERSRSQSAPPVVQDALPALALDFERVYTRDGVEVESPAQPLPVTTPAVAEAEPEESDVELLSPREESPIPTDGATAEELQKIRERLNLLETTGSAALQELEVLSAELEELEHRGVQEAQLLSGRIAFLASSLEELKRPSGDDDVPDASGGDLLSLGDARRSLRTTVRDSFSGGEAVLGRWAIDGRRAHQLDADSFFAKLRLPVDQPATSPVLYSVEIATEDEGWVGAGLHLFTSEVNRERGYGHGRSLLIWLTRDPDVYGSSRTYLQLYRSTGDVEMERIAHVALPERIEDGMVLEVLMDPTTNHITVATNGEERFRYFVFFSLSDGVEVALRSLGRAVFENLLVRDSM